MRFKVFKIIGVLAVVGTVAFAYLWFMPHRDVQATKTFAIVNASTLVNEFLSDKEKANAKYLDSDEGESKVLIITGKIAKIYKDQLGQQVVLLKNDIDKMGVSCTFTVKTNQQVSYLKIGDAVKIKGVIRSGAEYDDDLDLLENVIVEKSAIIK